MSFETWTLHNYEHLLNLYSIFYSNLEKIGIVKNNNAKLMDTFFRFLYENTKDKRINEIRDDLNKIEDDYINYLLMKNN
jgi:hypothetical protein